MDNFSVYNKLTSYLNEKLFEQIKPEIKNPKEPIIQKLDNKIIFSNLIERFFFYLLCFIVFIIMFVLIYIKTETMNYQGYSYTVPLYQNLNNFGMVFLSLFTIFVVICFCLDLMNAKLFKLPFKNMIKILGITDIIESIFFLPQFFVLFSALLIVAILKIIGYNPPTPLIFVLIYLNFINCVLFFSQNNKYLNIWKTLIIPFLCIIIASAITVYNIYLHNIQIKNCKNLDLKNFRDYFMNIDLYKQLLISFLILLFIFLPIILFVSFQLNQFRCGETDCNWVKQTMFIYLILMLFHILGPVLLYQSAFIQHKLNTYVGYWKCNDT